MSIDLTKKSDEELMKNYQDGQSSVFDVLFERHSGRVFGYLSKRITRKKEAEDLLQEVFFKLHRSKHLYHSNLPFSPWLFSITRSVLLDFAKKKNLEDPVEINEFNKMAAAEPSNVEQDLEGLVTALPHPQSEAISLRIYDERTFEEIAERLSTSPENARQLVSRGIKKIRQALKRKEEK